MFRKIKHLLKQKSSKNRGAFLSLELLGVLTVIAIVSVGFLEGITQSASIQKQRSVANQFNQVYRASSDYIEANYTTLETLTGGGPIEVNLTGVGPGGGLDSVQGEGFLPSTFQNVNGYNQSYSLLIRQDAAGRLDSILITTGGRQLNDNEVQGVITQSSNPSMGAILDNDLNTIKGASGGWEQPISDWSTAAVTPSQGRLIANTSFDSSTTISDYLSRRDTGDPEDNRMHTAIDMNTNDLNNARDVFARDITLAVDPDGNGGNITVGNDANIQNNLTVANNTTTGDLDVNTNARIVGELNVGGNATIDGTTTSTGRIYGNDGVETNILYDSDDTSYQVDPASTSRMKDIILTERGNIPISLLLPRYVFQAGFYVNSGTDIIKPPCNTTYGGEAKIFTIQHTNSYEDYVDIMSPPEDSGFDPTGTGVHIQQSAGKYQEVAYAIDNGPSWRVFFTSHSLDNNVRTNYDGSGAVQTFCFYPE